MVQPDLEKVVWGAPSFWIERLPLYCGRHLGYFRDQGVELETWISYGGPELAQAVARGDIHIGDMGLPPFVTAYTKGLPARIIGSSPIQQLDHYLVGTPPIESMADLNGKRIGILSRGSCDDYFIRRLLQSHGIDPEAAVELVPLGSSYGNLQVFVDAKVDAAFMVEPGIAAGENTGLFRVIARVGDYFPRYQWGIILASNRWLSERRDLVSRLMTAFRNACRWIHDHPEDTLKLGCDIFKVDEAVFRRALLRDLDRWQIDARIDFTGLHNALKVQEALGVAIDNINLAQMVQQV
jgi:NitT/TauT family transport system substrate-binding protein